MRYTILIYLIILIKLEQNNIDIAISVALEDIFSILKIILKKINQEPIRKNFWSSFGFFTNKQKRNEAKRMNMGEFSAKLTILGCAKAIAKPIISEEKNRFNLK